LEPEEKETARPLVELEEPEERAAELVVAAGRPSGVAEAAEGESSQEQKRAWAMALAGPGERQSGSGRPWEEPGERPGAAVQLALEEPGEPGPEEREPE
jgi:hypothetical protein